MISAPSEMRCRSMPIYSMIGKMIAMVSGIDRATTAPGRMPRLTMLTAMMMAMACHSDSMNSPMAFFTTTGWSDTSVDIDADRQVGHGGVDGLFDIAAEAENVAAVAHGDGEADGGLAIDAEHRLRRVGQRAAHFGDVAQADQAAVGQEIDVEQVIFGAEGAGHADRQLFVAGLQRARRESRRFAPARRR